MVGLYSRVVSTHGVILWGMVEKILRTMYKREEAKQGEGGGGVR